MASISSSCCCCQHVTIQYSQVPSATPAIANFVQDYNIFLCTLAKITLITVSSRKKMRWKKTQRMCKWCLLDCDQKDINKPTQRIEMLLTDYTKWTMLPFWGLDFCCCYCLEVFFYLLLGLSQMRNSMFWHFFYRTGQKIRFMKMWIKAGFRLEEYFLLHLIIKQKTLFCVYVYWNCIFKEINLKPLVG